MRVALNIAMFAVLGALVCACGVPVEQDPTKRPTSSAKFDRVSAGGSAMASERYRAVVVVGLDGVEWVAQ